MNLFKLLLTFFIFYLSHSQDSIDSDFNQMIFKEDFNIQNDIFPTESSNDNFFGIVNGEYFINRSTNSPYSIMIDWKNDLIDFEFSSSIKISPEKTNQAQSVGIILKYNPNSQEGLIFEINNSKKYRLTHITKDGNKYLSIGKDGWVKSNHIYKNGEKNTITIKTKKNRYNIFINGQNILNTNLSNRASQLTFGRFGIYLSSFTKAKISHIYISTLESYNGKNKIFNLSQDKIKKLLNDNEQLKKTIKKNTNQKIKELESAINILELELKYTNQLNDSLKKENEKFQSFKDLINGNENFLYTLSKDLKNQIEKNHTLKLNNKKLQDSIVNLIENQELFKLEYLKILDSLIESESISDTIEK